jgi:hemolysin activation/secretion protein
VDPAGARLTTRVRAEGAWARYDLARNQFGGAESRSAPYARGMAEASLARPFGALAASLTGAAGVAAGDRVPVQRLFYVGGLQTVRGQFAQPLGAGYVGNSFWLARAEVGASNVGFRPTVFYDAGWAGPRARFARPGRPLSGAGVGASFLDGLLRADLARGIAPQRAWRFDLSLDARF